MKEGNGSVATCPRTCSNIDININTENPKTKSQQCSLNISLDVSISRPRSIPGRAVSSNPRNRSLKRVQCHSWSHLVEGYSHPGRACPYPCLYLQTAVILLRVFGDSNMTLALALAERQLQHPTGRRFQPVLNVLYQRACPIRHQSHRVLPLTD